MLTAAERYELMANMRHLPAAVEAAVQDLTDDPIEYPLSRGGMDCGAGGSSSGRFTSERLRAHEVDAHRSRAGAEAI